MILVDLIEPHDPIESIEICPICNKLFSNERALYRHVVQAHRDGEYMSHSFQACLYERWQERIPHWRQ